MKKTLMMLWMAVSLMVSLVGCSSEEMNYENPDVTVFVKQLKAGTYNMKNEKGSWKFLISLKRTFPNY